MGSYIADYFKNLERNIIIRTKELDQLLSNIKKLKTGQVDSIGKPTWRTDSEADKPDSNSEQFNELEK